MAHPTQRARQRSKAIDDLRASCARLAERFDLIAPEIPERFTKDPSHLPTLQLEAVTKFLDALISNDGESVAANPPKPRTPSPKPGRAAIRA